MKATQSEIKAADESTKPFRFVLHDRFGIVSTHMETDPGTEKHAFHHGHYFPDAEKDEKEMEKAEKDYFSRCAKEKLNPAMRDDSLAPRIDAREFYEISR